MEAQKLRGLKGKELIRLESRARIVGLLSLASLAVAGVWTIGAFTRISKRAIILRRLSESS